MYHMQIKLGRVASLAVVSDQHLRLKTLPRTHLPLSSNNGRDGVAAEQIFPSVEAFRGLRLREIFDEPRCNIYFLDICL